MSKKKKVMVMATQKLPIILATIAVVCSFAFPAFAATTPKIMTGTTALANAGLNWILVLLPIVAAFALGWCKVQQMMSGNDPAVVASMNKWMRGIIIAAIIGETASALITSIVSYYK